MTTYTVIKNKGKKIKAYQLGSDNKVIKALMDDGRIRDIGNGKYEIYSQEAVNGAVGGEIAMAGDWIKIDGSRRPYPNNKQFFEKNHRHIEGDTFEQISKPLKAWDSKLKMCPEVSFLLKRKGLIIDKSSSDRYYSAELWGTKETAAKDAMIVFYAVSYDEDGNVMDCDWNFVERDEFERTYSIIE